MEPRPNVTVVPFTGGTAGARPPPLPEARSDDAEAALHASLLPLRAVRFAHAVNTRASLDRACADAAVNVLEGDVVLAGDAAVMGHDVGAAAADAVPVADWLAAAAAAGKGAKLDVKEFGAVAAVLAALGAHDVRVEDGGAPPWPVLRFPLSGAGFLTRPALFLNADVLAASGSGGRACAFNAGGRAVATADQVDAVRALVERVGDAAPSAIMSVGWTTGREGGEYVDADVDAMLAAVGDVAALGVAITFPVRASWVRPSWGTLQRLLAAGPLTSLTVWSNVALPADEDAWLRATLPPDAAMFDMPAPVAATAAPSRRGDCDGGDAALTRSRLALRSGVLAALASAFVMALVDPVIRRL